MSNKLIAIGDWQLNINSNTLQCQDKETQLEHKQVQLLLFLIAHAGDIVSKNILIDHVWSGRVVVEDVLFVAISQLRKAFVDSARTPVFIKTNPGQGYQFIYTLAQSEINKARVSVGIGTGIESITDGNVEETSKADNHLLNSIPSSSWLSKMILVVATIAVIGLVYIFQFSSNKSSPLTTQSTEIQQQYNQALLLVEEGKVEKLREAMSLLENLIAKDRNFSESYVLLAQIKHKLLSNKPLTLLNASKEIKALIKKSLSLNNESSEAHSALGAIYFFVDWDFSAAEKNYKQAINLDENNAEAHNQYSQLLLALGRFDQALIHTQIVRDLNPLAYSVPIAAWIYTMQRRYEEAWRETDKLLALYPDSITYHRSAQGIFEYMGREQNSFEHLKQMLILSGYNKDEIQTVNKLFNQGQLKAVYHWLAFDKKEPKNIGQYAPPFSWARYAVKAENKQAALNWLEECYQQHRTELLWIAIDPKFDSLHDEPKFIALLDKIGLKLP